MCKKGEVHEADPMREMGVHLDDRHASEKQVPGEVS